MIYDTILFDLDGTLLPMDYNEFMRGYLGILSQTVEPYGFKKETLIPALWKGVEAMVKNDGNATNCEVFWKQFSDLLGTQVLEYIDKFDTFYSNEFHQAIKFTAPTEKAKQAVDLAHSKAKNVVLATNPMFPKVAVQSRLEWAGLSIDDFDLVTHYSNSSFCKPNPQYYSEIVQKLGADPQKCLMIGNNTEEDIFASSKIGMKTFLLTPCLICDGDMPNCPQGGFNDLLTFLNNTERK